MALMTAAVVYEPGGPEALKVETRMIPTPEPGEVLIRIEALGLIGSGLLARRGQSVGVTFPRNPWGRGGGPCGGSTRERVSSG